MSNRVEQGEQRLYEQLLSYTGGPKQEGAVMYDEVLARLLAMGATIDANGVLTLPIAPVFNGSALENLNASQLTTGTVPVARLSGITNAQIDAAAAIAYSKLVLTGSITNADINAAAAIAYSKLNLTGSIVNADVNASAAIAWSKISKSGSSLADLATRSASDLNSGTLDSARLPANTGYIPGEIRMWPTASAPTDWLLCDGTAISRSTYATLFALIGTTYGAGNGSTTFNVPDFRGRAPIGAGTGSGLTARSLAATVGAESHTLSTSEIPAHSHGVTDPGHAHSVPISGSGTPASAAIDESDTDVDGSVASGTSATGISIQNAGGGGSHNNMQPSLVVNFIIKT
jgi:microcystin-dependent protein